MIASTPGHRRQCLISSDVINRHQQIVTTTEVSHDVDDAKDQTTRTEESEVGATLVTAILLGRLPARDKVVDIIRRTEWVIRVTKGIVEDLDDEHQDECEYEGGVEVRDVEGSAETTNEGVSTNNSGKKHSS